MPAFRLYAYSHRSRGLLIDRCLRHAHLRGTGACLTEPKNVPGGKDVLGK